MNEIHNPGDKCQETGIYNLVDEKGVSNGGECTVVSGSPFPATPEEGQSYLLSTKQPYVRQITCLSLYYLFLLGFSFLFFSVSILIFGEKVQWLTLAQVMKIERTSMAGTTMALMGYAMAGALMGSVLYQIRTLNDHYIKKNDYNPKWLSKNLTAPWESVALALIVLALIRGGVAFFGGTVGNGANDTSPGFLESRLSPPSQQGHWWDLVCEM